MWQARTELLLGKESMEILKRSHIMICGLGGVGAFAAEMLVRSGVGELTIVDPDDISETNINRQLLATRSNMGCKKVDLMKKRLMDINPGVICHTYDIFLDENQIVNILDRKCDYIVDTIDTLTPKIYLIYHTLKKNYSLVSSMGSGGKKDPSMVKVADFADTYNCNLSRNLRKRLKKLDVKGGFKCVFSDEKVAAGTLLHLENERNKKSTPGTISYMPPVFGCWVASVVIRDLINEPIPLTISPYKNKRYGNDQMYRKQFH